MIVAMLAMVSLPSISNVFSAPVLSPADSLAGNSWSVSVSGQRVEKEPVLEIFGTDSIQVPVSGGGSNTVFSQTNAEVEMEETSSAVMAILAGKPREGLTYHLKIGRIQSFELEFSSGSQVNTLESLDDGLLWGFGMGGRIAPGSIVSTAISWELGYTKTIVDLDRLQAGNAVSAPDLRYEETEFQGLVNFSRRWKTWDPYAGLKILRTTAKLKDRSTKQEVSGTTDGISPFIGLQWALADREVVAVEASFLEEESLSASIKLQF